MRKTTNAWKHALPLARLLLPAVWLLLMLACDKPDPLPKATQEGRNIFGCKINGKPWVPDGDTGFQATKPITGGFNVIGENPGVRRIWIRTLSKDKQQIHLHVEDVRLGEHYLSSDTQILPIVLFADNYGMYKVGSSTFTTSSKYTGKITITKADTITGLLAGTFEFTVGNSSGTTYEITEGRFDITSPQ